MVEIDPTDKPKFDSMMADYLYLAGKYGGAEMAQLMFQSLFAGHEDKLANMSDEEKSYIFAAGVTRLNQAAHIVHDQLFPFGHKNEPLEIGEFHV